MIVVDASAVLELLLRTPVGRRVEARLFDTPVPLHAPHLLDIEVAQVLRRFEARGDMTARDGRAALRMLPSLPIRRHSHGPFMERVWALRANLTAYDASYVALAEALAAVLVTGDARLARAPGHSASIEVID